MILPAYNEAENIATTVEQALEVLGPLASVHKVIVVNDGSTDSTGTIAADMAAHHPHTVVHVDHDRNLGYGAALRTGFAAGLLTGCDWVGFVDADGQFDLGELELLLDAAASHRAQFVAGYRAVRADRWSRRQLGTLWHELTSRIVNHGLRDVDCGFKIIHRDLLGSITLTGRYASISPELAAKARLAGTTVAQVRVTHYPRSGGEQTGANPKVVVRSLLGLVQLRRNMSAQRAWRSSQPPSLAS